MKNHFENNLLNLTSEFYLNKIVDNHKTEIDALFRDVYKKYINFMQEKHGIYSKELLWNSLDIIDVSSLYSDTLEAYNDLLIKNNISDSIKSIVPPLAYLSKYYSKTVKQLYDTNSFFNYIPCFEEGVLKINSKAWIHFKLTDLNLDEKKYELELTYYNQDPRNGGFGIRAIEFLYVNYKDDPAIPIETSSKYIPEYTLIKESNFLKENVLSITEQMVFTEYLSLLKEIDTKNKNIVSGHFKNPINPDAVSLTVTTLFSFVKINKLLQEERLSKGINPEKKNKNNKPIGNSLNNLDTEEPNTLYLTPSQKRKIRYLGKTGISITSKKIPKTPDQSYVKHYSVSSWSQIGHIRHLKSGKTIYIKPQTKHRHALIDKNIEIPQKQIVIKVEEEKEHD